MRYKEIYEYGFPRPIRTYFDMFSAEFKDSTKQSKLLDIGYLLTSGYDVRTEIHNAYRKHSSVSEGNVRSTLKLLLSELLGKEFVDVLIMHEHWTTDRIIDELFTQLSLYYHFPVISSEPHYLKAPSKQNEYDVEDTNGWYNVVKEFHCNAALYDITGQEYIYPGDEQFVHTFNENHNDKERYILNTVPCPWVGNPLTAKVIILSQNPGWDENSGEVIPLILRQIPEIAEEIMEFFRNTFTFQFCSFMPLNYETTYGFSIRDVYNLMTCYYWKNRFHFLTDAGVNEEAIYDNVALVQYIPYHSVNYASLPTGVTLPSQLFTRRLLNYVSRHNKDTIFIVCRAVKLWKDLLGNEWTALEKEGRVITHLPNTYRSQYISPSCLGQRNFDRIVNLFNSNNE